MKVLDLELLLNQARGIFKPDEEGLEEDITLQAAVSAQVRKTNCRVLLWAEKLNCRPP